MITARPGRRSAVGEDALNALFALVADLPRHCDAVYDFCGHARPASLSAGRSLDGACILDLLLVDAFGISIDEVRGSFAAACKRLHRFIVQETKRLHFDCIGVIVLGDVFDNIQAAGV